MKERSLIYHKLGNRETVFKIFKEICFGGDAAYNALEVLQFYDNQSIFSRRLDLDGSFMLKPEHLTSRLMSGYNPKRKVNFIAIKGLVYKGSKLEENVQVFCEQYNDNVERAFGWITNGNTNPLNDKEKTAVHEHTVPSMDKGKIVVHEDTVLSTFLGDQSIRNKTDFLDCEFSDSSILSGLQIFIQAPRIKEVAHEILVSANLPRALASLTIGFYNCEIDSSRI